jgi:hypothetical protein
MKQENRHEPGKANQKATGKSWTTLLGIFSACLLLILAALAIFQTLQPGSILGQKGSPRLTVDVEEINLGEIPVGQSVQAAFRLTNTGTQALKFSEAPFIEVKEGC